MLKLYFKKLLHITLYSGVILLIYFCSSTILLTVSNFFGNLFFKFLILIGIPLTILLILVYKSRSNNSDMRRAYLKCTAGTRLDIGDELRRIIKDQHFIAEVLAAFTVFLPLAFIGVTDADLTLFAGIMKGIGIYVIINIAYILIDVFHWMLVYRNWLKNRADTK